MTYALVQDGPYTPIFIWHGKYLHSVGPYDGPELAELALIWLRDIGKCKRLPTERRFPADTETATDMRV